MALGAQRGHVLRLVYRATMGSVLTGMAAGVALALALNSLLAHWTSGNARDPVILPVGALLLGAVAGLACAIPAWRATQAEPAACLRFE